MKIISDLVLGKLWSVYVLSAPFARVVAALRMEIEVASCCNVFWEYLWEPHRVLVVGLENFWPVGRRATAKEIFVWVTVQR